MVIHGKYQIYLESSIDNESQKVLDDCCKTMGVPNKCMGICMGGCKQTSSKMLSFISPNNACHKYAAMVGACCTKNYGMFIFDLIDSFP